MQSHLFRQQRKESRERMQNIEFRKATIEDVDTLARLRLQQLREEGATPDTDISHSLESYFKESLANGTFLSWLALYNGEIIATSGIALNRLPPYYGNANGIVGQVVNMHTLKEFRRKGIASKLLNIVMEEAVKLGCTTFRVSASETGKFLYKSMGFSMKTNMLEIRL